MSSSTFTDWFASLRALVTLRWRQLLIAIGGAALAGAVAWFVLAKLAGSAGSSATGGSSGGEPSMVTLYGIVLVSWLILVAIFTVPFAAVSGALTDDDPEPVAWLPRAGTLLVPVAVRLAIVTGPFALLSMWLLHDLVSMFSQAFSATGAADPGTPLSFSIAKALFGTFAMRALVGTVLVGITLLWTATRATDTHEELLPHAPWKLFDRSPVMVGALSVVSAIVLGPMLGKALGSAMGSAMGSSAAQAAGESSAAGASAAGVFVVGVITSAFLGAVATLWIALYRDADVSFEPMDATTTDDPAAGAAAAVPAAPAPTPEAPAAAQVVDQAYVVAAGASAGGWWYVPAGAQVGLQSNQHPTTGVVVAVADSTGAWLGIAADPTTGVSTFVAPAAAWYLLGLANSSPAPVQAMVRLTLPPEAQPAPAQQAG